MKTFIFHQLFEKETSTYTYLIGDPKSKQAIIIDPTIDMVSRDLQLIHELDLNLKYILETHVHADHITGAYNLKQKTQGQIAISKNSGAIGADIYLEDNDQLTFGNITLKALATPGHTHSCMSYYIEGLLFTGDALLIRGTGRTDFQQGNSKTLFASIRNKIFNLPDETLIYPGHDYKGHTSSSVAQEKRHNPRVKMQNTEDDFISIMSHLKLDHPKRINEAVPANMRCGNIHSSNSNQDTNNGQ